MSSVEVSGDVDAPPVKVYGILSDYRVHHPRILPKPTFESLVVEEGGVGAGTRIRVTMRVMGSRSTLRMRVSEPEPGRVLREVVEENGAVTTFTVAPLAEGQRSRVTIQTTWPRRAGLRGWVESRINARVAPPLYRKELALLDEYARGVPDVR